MNRVTINGISYTSRSSISITNGRVIIDGKEQVGEPLSGVVEVRVVEGVIGELNSDASVTCGLVTGNVIAGGSVHCDDVGGNIQAGGSVHSGAVGGSVMAGGSVRHG